jgi:hypothetical protein
MKICKNMSKTRKNVSKTCQNRVKTVSKSPLGTNFTIEIATQVTVATCTGEVAVVVKPPRGSGSGWSTVSVLGGLPVGAYGIKFDFRTGSGSGTGAISGSGTSAISGSGISGSVISGSGTSGIRGSLAFNELGTATDGGKIGSGGQKIGSDGQKIDFYSKKVDFYSKKTGSGSGSRSGTGSGSGSGRLGHKFVAGTYGLTFVTCQSGCTSTHKNAKIYARMTTSIVLT